MLVLGMFTSTVNATENKMNDLLEKDTYESCVSVANKIANGDSKIFRAAYVGCINGRMNN